MDGRGGKEGKKDGRCGGWHCQTGGGEEKKKGVLTGSRRTDGKCEVGFAQGV